MRREKPIQLNSNTGEEGLMLQDSGAVSPSGGRTPRRVIKSLKMPSACVMQLVQLDGQSQNTNRMSTVTPSMRSDFSVSEVRSEIGTVDDRPDTSLSSFFDRHLRQVRGPRAGNCNLRRSNMNDRQQQVTASRRVIDGPTRASARGNGDLDVEDSAILSYASSPSFYTCDSLNSSETSSRSSDRVGSLSFTALSESVQSCSLTLLVDQAPRQPAGWGRMHRQAPVRHNSGSFGSIWGDCGFGESGTCSTTQVQQQSRAAMSDSSKRPQSCSNSKLRPDLRVSSLQARPPQLSSNLPGAETLPAISRRTSAEVVPTAVVVNTPDGCTVPSTSKSGVSGSPIEDATTPSGCGVTDTAGSSSTSDKGEEHFWRVTNVRREERIGRGSYGDVYRGTDLDTHRFIAIKEILVPKDFNLDLEKQLQAVEREVTVMRKLHHPNTISYLGAHREDNCLSIYMEYVSGGTVGELLRSQGPLSEERTRNMTIQLLRGLEYLHSRQILHRDLKGDNLFLCENDGIKLGDFGTSKQLVTTLVTDSVAGTPNFMAPEVIACSGHSYAADIWSVGCCMIEMLTAQPPFARLDNQMAVMFAVMKGRLEEQVPAHISAGAREFIKVCTKNEAKERWTASQLLQHSWLTGAAQPTAVPSYGAKAKTTTLGVKLRSQLTISAESDGLTANSKKSKPSSALNGKDTPSFPQWSTEKRDDSSLTAATPPQKKRPMEGHSTDASNSTSPLKGEKGSKRCSSEAVDVRLSPTHIGADTSGSRKPKDSHSAEAKTATSNPRKSASQNQSPNQRSCTTRSPATLTSTATGNALSRTGNDHQLRSKSHHSNVRSHSHTSRCSTDPSQTLPSPPRSIPTYNPRRAARKINLITRGGSTRQGSS